jgi:transcription elongation GreA/GreB family factor
MYLKNTNSLPKINIIALSPQSPLGNKLMGNEVGFAFEINNTKYKIERIE